MALRPLTARPPATQRRMNGAVDKRCRLVEPSAPAPLTFVQGWPADTPSCPRCGGLLEHEPAFLRCRFGCGRLWPIVGAALAPQQDYETSAGLSFDGTPVDGRAVSAFTARRLRIARDG